MNQENTNESLVRHLHGQCQHYMHHHVVATNTDGSTFDGIIVNVDINYVTILVGEDIMEDQDTRQYGDFDDNGYGYGYGRPRRRYRRYRPRRTPLASLAALSLLPYAFGGFQPYYPYPAYPYGPYPY